ncbi:helix-turn-helix domain-containing protein [Arcobacter vandammei]|jgi:transcriptional regulator with XRE-family HTH domain|uniref:helix-turn-helix domain-containing protein n=1 Tax=Arcobacter vandammei TaxID=2782243 RepID=UPI0018DF0718|nr:helix-turn-helix transcriptional regulator [Arcobacter vandammei]
MSYNNKIQIIIDKMGLSQKDFANKLGVSQNAISHYLLGKRNPDINTIQKLIDLGVSPLFLFSNSKNPFDETYKLFSEANKYLNEDNKNELISPMNEFIRKYNLINVIKSKIEKIKGQNFFQKIIQEFSNRGERIIKLLYYFIIYIEESQKDFDFLNIKNSFITELEKFKLSKKDKIVSFEIKDEDKKRLIEWIKEELDDPSIFEIISNTSELKILLLEELNIFNKLLLKL